MRLLGRSLARLGSPTVEQHLPSTDYSDIRDTGGWVFALRGPPRWVPSPNPQ